jgi:hypothetical protein
VTKRSDDARAACRSPEAHSWPTIRRSIALDGNFPFAMTKSASAPTLPLGDEERTDAGELLYVGAEACGCQARAVAAEREPSGLSDSGALVPGQRVDKCRTGRSVPRGARRSGGNQ